MTDHLKPCPRCGGTDLTIDERRLSPTMKGPGALISVRLQHVCDIQGNPLPCGVTATGRDMEAAVRAWNTRADEWIEVDPSTLSQRQHVLVVLPGWSRACEASISHVGWMRPDGSFHEWGDSDKEPTHWQPLPEPPKGE